MTAIGTSAGIEQAGKVTTRVLDRVSAGTASVKRLVKNVGGRSGPELAPAVLLVSSRHRLWQRYGPDGVFAIERAVGELCEAMALRGLVGTLAYLDDSPLIKCMGLLPADAGNAQSVGKLVSGLSERLAWTDETARYVLILGDDGVVPFHKLPNPSPDADDAIYSDHPYSTDPAQPLHIVRSVGRIPDVGLTGLVGAIRAAAAAHMRLASRERLRPCDGAFGYSASVWKRAARGVFAAVGEPPGLRLSPPLSYEDCPLVGPEGPRFRYYNLHGLADSPHWFGQRDPSFPADYPFFPVALRPDDLIASPGSVIVTEACYGAQISGRAARDSMALTALAGGTLGFVGATGVAYGGLDGPLVAADLLARRLLDGLAEGLPAGDALARAKRALVTEALERQGYLDAEDEKAIYNFVLYGDPSLVHHLPSVFAEDAAGGGQAVGAVEWAGPADMVGTLPVRPHNIAIHGPARAEPVSPPAGLTDKVRSAVARRLPEFTAPDVIVEVTSSGARSCAKAPNVAGRPPAEQLVVTLSRSQQTCEGPSCCEIVRVTVDGAGRIRKVAVSR